jgi:PAS domain S-box-containing protein
MSTSRPQIPGKREILVCLEDITERKRTEEQVRTNLRMQQVINQILQSSLETASQVEFLQKTLDLLVSIPWLVLQKKGCIFLKDEDSETLTMVAHRGIPDDLLKACKTLPFGKCLCGRAAVSQEILFVDRVDDLHEVRYPGMDAHGHYCVPIASEDRLYGVLNLYVNAGHQRIAEEEAFLLSVSSVLAITVRRKEAEEALRNSEQRFDLAVRGTDAGIWDWDTRSNEVYFSPQWKGMLGYGEEELSNDFSQWSNRLHPDDRERALATVQDYLEGRTTEYELEHRLRHKDNTYRWILARGAAVRDATGKVYRMVGSHLDITSLKRAEHALREKEAELIAAAEIQNFLLPQQSVSVPGFSIAGRCYPTEVAAGDYFDYLWLPDGSFLIVLGDVTGHGLGPAIVTAAAHARFRALCENHSDLTQIALRANAALYRKTRDDMFLTLIAGRIDLTSRGLTYFNAGHPPAQVLDSAGDVKATLEPTSMPLAVLPDLEATTGAPVALADDDVVLFYTDGLVEAQPPRGSPFGIDRALQVVRDNRRRCAAEIIEALHAAVCRHMGTKRFHDDLTLVVVKVDSLPPENKE